MNDFVTARIEYISADDSEVLRTDVRAHRITCMRNAGNLDDPAVLRRLRINGKLIESDSNRYDFIAGTKIEGCVITAFIVSSGNFLVEYLE